MKKILLLVLSLSFLSGCSLIGNNQPQNTGAIANSTQTQDTGVIIPNTQTRIANTGPATSAITGNYGYITEVYSAGGKNYLKIDYIEYGPMGPGGAPEIINNNPLIRTFEISDTATFEILKYNSAGGQQPQNVQRNEFEIRGNGIWAAINPDVNHPIYYGCGKTSIVEIQHDTQTIYKVTEIYRP